MVSTYTSSNIERLPVTILQNSDEASRLVADEIAKLITSKQSTNDMAILGLATGSTPIRLYQELVRKHKEEGLSFSNVVTFNLDEYYPMTQESLQSYWYFMHLHLFDHVDIKPENIHIPDGMVEAQNLRSFCYGYEEQIDKYGGIDLQVLGIGRTGHIGFNEPGSPFDSETRLVKLDHLTIADATKDFIREEFVPRRAITMGVRSIFKAGKIYLLAWGEAKAPIIKKAVEGEITEDIPASFLQRHTNVEVLIDVSASLELARVKTPWVVSIVDWNDKLAKRAAIWLSLKIETPILKLTDQDYRENGLGDLLALHNGSHALNIHAFNALQNTITGWPGGKPNSDDSKRPERALPVKKRVIIFSPHPDDDVISMGGTLLKLVEQGHEVHVAYQTSGNIAVFDDDARRFADFAQDLLSEIGISNPEMNDIHSSLVKDIKNKKDGERDSVIIRKIKGLIRKGEATAAARFCGIKQENIHFLNLPFYETGEVYKKSIGEKDLQIITDLLQEIKPHQIFAAGDLRDPHGTHKVCLDVIYEALGELKDKKWVKNCYMWLYRGAWQEWSIDQIEMSVPISPMELMNKRRAIFKHQSQKDSPVFPGDDEREFWQRSEDRNKNTAKIYDKLGLTEYEAIEAFVRHKF